MRKLSLSVLSISASCASAFAHAGHAHEKSSWNFGGWETLTIALAIVLYGLGLRNLRARAGAGRAIGAWEVAAFAGGIASLVLALQSPIDVLAEELFSVHMVQHLILMLVCAPLFVCSRPLVVFFWAFPRDLRKSLGRLWGGGRLGVFFHVLTSPVSVWTWFCGLFVFWHLPGPYAWALKHEPVHVFEHLCFFLSSFAFWSVVIEPSGRRRLDYGASLLFVATAAVLSGLPGALMVLTTRPFYGVHAEGAARWGLTLLEDQQLAGLVMWIPAGFAYMAAIVVLFVFWLRAAEKRAVANLRRFAAVGSASVLVVCVLAGCDGRTGEESTATLPATGFGGDPQQGATEIARIGCGSCHTIPGITGANGLVGPPLNQMGRRVFVAGLLRNTPDNMMIWLRDPQRIVPGNAMPNMGLKEQQARDITAYLYTLR